ncbi:MAG TPA: response regulator transcription factor [Syntrophales bacterium]|nr:response regulator transcription factor [Syntrophales bacterium]HOL59126.1 response regulator transcription factor [Syntrophales bacterium]HPO36071.1 response regulator transcription factor [Syntrophales bacterium]
MKKISVLIADDHEVVRDGIKELLRRQPDIEIVGEAANGKEAVARVRKLHPAVVLLDISMPELNGLEAISLMRRVIPPPEVVVLTMHDKDSFIRQLFNAGAKGFVLKASPSKEIVDAIRAACRGEMFISPKLQERVVGGYLRTSQAATHYESRYDLLTEREQQVFRLIAQGKSSKDIANFLCISVKTVEKHRTHIMQKLGLHDRVDIVKYAIKIGIIDPDL